MNNLLKKEIANDLLKKCILSSDIDRRSWIFMDFVVENRFMDEIDGEIEIDCSTPYELCLFACVKLGNGLAQICEDEFYHAE